MKSQLDARLVYLWEKDLNRWLKCVEKASCNAHDGYDNRKL